MWHCAPQSGNDCVDPDRGRFDGWNHQQHHGGGWGEHGGFNGPSWGGDCGRPDDPGFGGGFGDCHDDRGFGGFGDCHDGGRGLISFDHNSFLVCH